jgi:hypothetical protein
VALNFEEIQIMSHNMRLSLVLVLKVSFIGNIWIVVGPVVAGGWFIRFSV